MQQELLCKPSSSLENQTNAHNSGIITNGNHIKSNDDQNALSANIPNHESSPKPTTKHQFFSNPTGGAINGASVGSNNLNLSEVSGSSHHPPCSTPSHSSQSSGRKILISVL